MVGVWLLCFGALCGAEEQRSAEPGSVQRIESAATLLGAGQPDAALAALNEVPARAQDARYSRLLAETHLGLRNFPKAVTSVREAIRLEPRDPSHYLLLGDIHLANRNYALAASAYEKAEGFGDDSAELHQKLAESYFKLGNHLGELVLSEGDCGRPGELLVDRVVVGPAPGTERGCLVAPRNSAIYQACKALRRDGGNSDVQRLIADIWLASGRYANAMAVFQALAAENRFADDPAFARQYAEACLGAGDLEGFLALARQSAMGGTAGADVELARAYRRAAEHAATEGTLEHYLEYLQRAADLAPEDCELHRALGDALHEAGEEGEAGRHWRWTLQLCPSHPDRIKLLQQIEAGSFDSPDAP